MSSASAAKKPAMLAAMRDVANPLSTLCCSIMTPNVGSVGSMLAMTALTCGSTVVGSPRVWTMSVSQSRYRCRSGT